MLFTQKVVGFFSISLSVAVVIMGNCAMNHKRNEKSTQIIDNIDFRIPRGLTVCAFKTYRICNGHFLWLRLYG